MERLVSTARSEPSTKGVKAMRKSYNFSKGQKNPYAKRLKQQVTIRLDVPTIDYFKDLAEETGIPYQTLINLFLRECAFKEKRPRLDWVSKRAS